MGKSADPALIGRTIAGKFAIDSYLGGGAMGAVYKARQVALEKTVAVKVLHRELAADGTFAARFHREAKAASRLDHPNSMRVIDFGEDADGLLYIAMEFLDGRDLLKVILEDWPLSGARIAGIVMQALAALAVAHDMGVVHRDLKPENIMVLKGENDEGQSTDIVKVCDFGIAKITASRNPKDTAGGKAGALTTQGLVVGTPEYMSPEQGKGESLDARSDLYSTGVILYQLLTGRVPFEAESALGVVLKHVTEEPVRPSSINGTIDPRLEEICLKALKKPRDDRYQTARAMRAELRVVLEGTPMRASSSSGETTSGPMLGLAATMVATPLGALTPAQHGGPATQHGVETPSQAPRPSDRLTTSETAAAALSDAPLISKRPIWPAVAVLALVVGAAGGGIYYTNGAHPSGGTAAIDPPATMSMAIASASSAPAASVESAPSAPDASPSSGTMKHPPAHPASTSTSTSTTTPTPTSTTTTTTTASALIIGPPFNLLTASADASVTHAQGTTSRDVLASVPRWQFTQCYRDALEKTRKRLAGRMNVHVTTDAAGLITHVALSAPQQLAQSVGACITASLDGIPIHNVTLAASADIDIDFKPE